MNNKITLLTSKTCPKCPEAKKYLDDNKIEYEILEFPIDAKAVEIATRLGITSVPTIVFDDETFTLDAFKLAKHK